MTIEQILKDDCTGCGLCKDVCAKQSISMQPDAEGYLRPVINHNTCVDCGSCYKKCPVNVDLKHQNEPVYYSASIKDEDALMKSSSGGLFHALAVQTIKEGGYVCGCIINDEKEAVHVCTNDACVLEKMRGSKYMQSEIFDVLPEIKNLLNDGKKVLFTGTACQVAAVRQFIKDAPNLITVDILCHGVPSPKYFKSYIDYLEKRYKGTLQKLEFRNKVELGWGAEHRTYVEIKTKDGVRKIRPTIPSYFSAFFYGLNLRFSCYSCKYAGTARVSDITIGDFWGSFIKYGVWFPKGISIASVNTDKGVLLFEKIKPNLELCDKLEQKEALGSNTNFYHPTQNFPERSKFYEYINEDDAYRKTRKKVWFCKSTRRKLLVSLYGRFMPKSIKNIYQRIKYGSSARKN